MSGLLPSESDAVAAEDADDSGGTRLLRLDNDDAETLLGSLSSDTARSVLITLHEEPKTASELADHVDTSLQNVRHHLNSLMEAELVETTDTRYSVKGREMAVYEPVNDSLVLCVGDTEERTSLLSSLRKYIGAAAALVVGSLLVQSTFGLALPGTEGPTSPRVADSVGSSGELLGVVSPGTAFLAGGLVVLLVVALTTYRKTH